MQKACCTITSSATAAETLRTLSGTTCPSLPPAPWASGLCANANSFSAGSAPSARQSTVQLRVAADCPARSVRSSSHSTHSKEKEHMAKEEQFATAVRKPIPGNHQQTNGAKCRAPSLFALCTASTGWVMALRQNAFNPATALHGSIALHFVLMIGLA
jgi:hypothetical protein